MKKLVLRFAWAIIRRYAPDDYRLFKNAKAAKHEALRSDLSDVIDNLCPSETPFLYASAPNSRTLYEWDTDALKAQPSYESVGTREEMEKRILGADPCDTPFFRDKQT